MSLGSRSQIVARYFLLLGSILLPAQYLPPSMAASLVVEYSGMCDASAGVFLDAHLFAVANDEDSTIRIYDTRTNGPPVKRFDLQQFLNVDREKKPETDFEGATWLNGRIFWISSHGRNREGKFRASRHRFFATRWETNAGPSRLAAVGRPYVNLLRDMERHPKLRRFNFTAAAKLPPKLPGALNVEGLCATPDNHLLIGFRNPIPNDHALLVPLLNPNDLVAGITPQFGDPILLDLDGLGIRDISFVEGRYLIVAGAYHGGGESRLYVWKGDSNKPQRLPGSEFRGLNPEALVGFPERPHEILVLSDDGTRKLGGIDCKLLPNEAARKFRSVWVNLP